MADYIGKMGAGITTLLHSQHPAGRCIYQHCWQKIVISSMAVRRGYAFTLIRSDLVQPLIGIENRARIGLSNVFLYL
jgi:hypothetical protein